MAAKISLFVPFISFCVSRRTFIAFIVSSISRCISSCVFMNSELTSLNVVSLGEVTF